VLVKAGRLAMASALTRVRRMTSPVLSVGAVNRGAERWRIEHLCPQCGKNLR
jgi:hypothetical protein